MKVKLEDDGEDNSELIEEIEDSFIEEYIPLPGQYEINEYRIIEEFIYDLPEDRNQDTLERTIQGKGATLNDRYIYGSERFKRLDILQWLVF